MAWLIVRTKTAVLREKVSTLEEALLSAEKERNELRSVSSDLRTENAGLDAKLEEERRANAEKLQLINSAEQQLKNAFQALAADALRDNNESFLQLAKTSLGAFQADAKSDLEARRKAVAELVDPIKTSLTKVDSQIKEVEKARIDAYATLTEQVRSLISTQEQLRSETGNLVKALRTPAVRGRWGEIQLRRVVEIAGMLKFCDFDEQVSVDTDDGRLRPDLVVKLPGGKNIVVDAKTPLSAYLDAMETTDEQVRKAKLHEHAQQVRAHMTKLGLKSYSDQFKPAPEFIVMFLPGEAFFSAALEQDTGLIEHGVGRGVIPASPTTLIALLKAVAYGWAQERVAENAQQISEIGKQLYDRLCTFANHLHAVGKGLDRAVEFYNKAASSLESRVLVSARRFAELGAAPQFELPEPAQVETTSRTLALVWAEEDDQLPMEQPPDTKQTTDELES